jgi:hypothetical protein
MPHHAEGVFNPNAMNQKMVTDFEYPRACRFRKTLPKIMPKIGQNWSKLVNIDRFANFLGLFSRFLGRGTHKRIFTTNIVKNNTFSKKSKKSIFGHFLPILATFYEVKLTF